MKKQHITFIGSGNMAEAIVKGIVSSGAVAPQLITMTDINEERLTSMRDCYGVQTTGDNSHAVQDADMVVLAVKPQVFAEVVTALAEALPQETVLVSVAAGVKAETIDRYVGGKGRIIRVMPNTPCLVGAGASAVAPGPRAQEEDLQWTEQLLARVGVVERVREDQMDAVTALSGSGPAYVFYLLESMLEAAEAEGLDRRQAETLAYHTVIGAGRLAAESGVDPAELRRRVTSPGGTTQAALTHMEAGEVKAHIAAGIRMASARSRELSEG